MANNIKAKQKEQRKRFRDWENPKTKDTYIRFGTETLRHENFINLSNNAKVLYMYMKSWAYNNKDFLEKHDNGGLGEFEYSVSLARKVLKSSIQTALNTIHELEKCGFIERQNNSASSRETSRWKFCEKWHTKDAHPLV